MLGETLLYRVLYHKIALGLTGLYVIKPRYRFNMGGKNEKEQPTLK